MNKLITSLKSDIILTFASDSKQKKYEKTYDNMKYYTNWRIYSAENRLRKHFPQTFSYSVRRICTVNTYLLYHSSFADILHKNKFAIHICEKPIYEIHNR